MPEALNKQLPPDPENMNGERAGWAEAAIQAFMGQTGTDRCDALADLLCDLMHWADRNDEEATDDPGMQDFEQALERARMHYKEETMGSDDTEEDPGPDADREEPIKGDGFTDPAEEERAEQEAAEEVDETTLPPTAQPERAAVEERDVATDEVVPEVKPKFKVGDVVKVVHPADSPMQGNVGRVISVTPGGGPEDTVYSVESSQFAISVLAFFDDELELVSDAAGRPQPQQWGGYAGDTMNAPKEYDAIEVHGVRDTAAEQGIKDGTACEVDDDNPEFFSTYLHLRDGGVECVGDFEREVGALRYAGSLRDVFGWPVRHRYDIEQARKHYDDKNADPGHGGDSACPLCVVWHLFGAGA